MIVLSEAHVADRHSINDRELNSITEAARLFGCRVYPLPPSDASAETIAQAFAYVPAFDTPQLGIWVGYIPTPERYTMVYQAALANNIHLVNTPAQYQTAMEFDRFYPLLGELTPLSRVITTRDQLETAANAVGFPIFVKGAVKSNKEQGWQACVATTMVELIALTNSVLAQPHLSRGRVILRKLVPLRTIATDYQAFPLGREYRVFVYQNRVLAYGFYWDEYADSTRLSSAEEQAICSLAVDAAQRVGTPLIAVDIGQLASGDWIVIEVGDGQFSGLSQVPVLELWSKLTEL